MGVYVLKIKYLKITTDDIQRKRVNIYLSLSCAERKETHKTLEPAVLQKKKQDGYFSLGEILKCCGTKRSDEWFSSNKQKRNVFWKVSTV
jgi:hypothetical protein